MIRLMPIALPVPAFSDNYIWVIIADHQAIVVDPGDAAPVQHFLQQRQLSLAAILITHWHKDHTGGVDTLLAHYPDTPVIGPVHSAIAATQKLVQEGSITVAGIDFQVMQTPGHTLEHVAYYQPQQQWLFCGDTLFAAGCGRIFEGTPAIMLQSLQKLASLPATTQIYCAHEYTLANLRFAAAAEPDNPAIDQRMAYCQNLRDKDLPTLPSTLHDEQKTNPFLRVAEPAVINTALSRGAASAAALDVFTCLREWKNNF